MAKEAQAERKSSDMVINSADSPNQAIRVGDRHEQSESGDLSPPSPLSDYDEWAERHAASERARARLIIRFEQLRDEGFPESREGALRQANSMAAMRLRRLQSYKGPTCDEIVAEYRRTKAASAKNPQSHDSPRYHEKGDHGSLRSPAAPVVATPPASPVDAGIKANAKASSRKAPSSRGESQTKLEAALTAHHRYSCGACQNYEPIGATALAKLAGLGPGAKSSASRLFRKWFGGYSEYKAACFRRDGLLLKLRVINRDIFDKSTCGSQTPNERQSHGF